MGPVARQLVNIWPPLGECVAFACRATAERIGAQRLPGLSRQRGKALARSVTPAASQTCVSIGTGIIPKARGSAGPVPRDHAPR